MHCIETTNLRYRFPGQEPVLKGIDLRVPEGSVYGFLGPNGAGKTTTLKLLLGLLKKQEGEILLFNQPFEKNRISILRQLGSMIESPSLYSHLTATENLTVWQKLYQCPRQRIGEVLDIVGLSATGKKTAGHFSLGMKQRLSIAVALLQNPEILVLDEPTNGLDPNGIIDIRELLKTLNRENGMTIVISSHLLSEIEKMVTHIGIIHEGNLLFQGTMDTLQQQQDARSGICFETENAEKTAAILRENGLLVTVNQGEVRIPVIGKEKIALINRQLVTAGVAVYRISREQSDLESIFIDITK
jgi:ABC-2 type transport system ATP-binding protein